MTTLPLPHYLLKRVATPVRGETLVIEPSFVEGCFDSLAVDSSFAFTLDGRKGMTYIGWDGTGHQTALSWCDEDGAWSPGTVIFSRDQSNPLRQYNAALTSILRDNALASAGELRAIDGWYYGTFHAYPSPGYEADPASISIVRSRDLLTWEQIGDTLTPELGGDWERGGLYKFWLLE